VSFFLGTLPSLLPRVLFGVFGFEIGDLARQNSQTNAAINLARRTFQPLALLRCHCVKGNGILFNVLAIALRAADVAFVMFPEGENQFK